MRGGSEQHNNDLLLCRRGWLVLSTITYLQNHNSIFRTDPGDTTAKSYQQIAYCIE